MGSSGYWTEPPIPTAAGKKDRANPSEQDGCSRQRSRSCSDRSHPETGGDRPGSKTAIPNGDDEIRESNDDGAGQMDGVDAAEPVEAAGRGGRRRVAEGGRGAKMAG
jgi:hypothetical protein